MKINLWNLYSLCFAVHLLIQLFVCGKWREVLVCILLQDTLSQFIVSLSALMENTWQVDHLTNAFTFGLLRFVLPLKLFLHNFIFKCQLMPVSFKYLSIYLKCKGDSLDSPWCINLHHFSLKWKILAHRYVKFSFCTYNFYQ